MKAWIFLDVDGVLNRCGVSNQGLESDKLLRLRALVRKLQAHGQAVTIVITSTWRSNQEQLRRLMAELMRIDSIRITATPLSGGTDVNRAADISSFMLNHNVPLTDCVILDDTTEDLGCLEERRVRTQSHVGLTDADIEQAYRKMEGVLVDHEF